MSDNNISYELQQIQSTLAALTERLAASTATQVGSMQMYIAVGWSPIIALTDDGTYYYAQILDWTGGSGIKPPVMQYLCETGWTNNVAEAARVGIVGGGLPDGDKGDITVASGVWTIDNGVVTETKLGARSVTAAKLFEVGHEKLIGRHGAGAGDAQEIGIDGGLELHGGNIRRSALTGDVTASAGSNTTTLANSGVTAATYGSASAIPIITVDAKGRVTSVTTDTPSAGIGGTLGATDNALTRADGTGGATAQGSSLTLDDSANLVATNWTVGSGVYSGRTYARLGAVAANLALILSPTGTGFISSQVPDGTTTGGNLRGDNAVDFTYSRSVAANVASGAGAVSFHKSRASGTDSFSLGNSGAAGTNSFSLGSASASGTNSIASGQSSSTASGTLSFTHGFGTTSSGNYSFSLGLFSTASASFSSATGERASATLHGQFSEASGMFGATGDAQRSRISARRATTDATPSNLFLDGSSARWVVPANSSGTAMVTVVARTATAGAETMTWRRRVNWQRGVAVGTVTVDVETVGTDRGYSGGAWGAGPAWTISITADTTNGAINIIGTGVAATNIRWLAEVQWGETTFA